MEYKKATPGRWQYLPNDHKEGPKIAITSFVMTQLGGHFWIQPPLGIEKLKKEEKEKNEKLKMKTNDDMHFIWTYSHIDIHHNFYIDIISEVWYNWFPLPEFSFDHFDFNWDYCRLLFLYL